MFKASYWVEYVIKKFYNHREHEFSAEHVMRSESVHDVEHDSMSTEYGFIIISTPGVCGRNSAQLISGV